MRRIRRPASPSPRSPRITCDDLAEHREMAEPTWSLGTILAGNPGWAERGMHEVAP